MTWLSHIYMWTRGSYVYWTVHHLDSWIKIDQLDVTCFIISLFTVQRVSKVSTSIFRSLRLICWVISCVVLLSFDVCWCYGVVRLGWCGILMQVEELQLFHGCLSYFMGYVAPVRCVLVLRRGSAGVVWYPYAGRSATA